MTRRGQYAQFKKMQISLLIFCSYWEIPIRDGEFQRPEMVAKDYARRGVGIINSKHRKSLAEDYWIIHAFDATDITWIPIKRERESSGNWIRDRALMDSEIDQLDLSGRDKDRIKQAKRWLQLMGEYWEHLGGTWGGHFKRYDPYHFEIKGPVAKS